jgi:hypothetical protein
MALANLFMEAQLKGDNASFLPKRIRAARLRFPEKG